VTGSVGTSYVFVGDRWIRANLYDSAPVWLPLKLSGTTASLTWYDSWSLNVAAGTWAAQTADTAHEGEAAANTLAGGARLLACSSCSGGRKAGWIGNGGTAQFNGVIVPTAGRYTLKVRYTNGDAADRYADVSVNGAAARRMAFPPSGSGNSPATAVLTVDLRAGANTVKFSNASGWAPDLDKLAVPTP